MRGHTQEMVRPGADHTKVRVPEAVSRDGSRKGAVRSVAWWGVHGLVGTKNQEQSTHRFYSVAFVII